MILLSRVSMINKMKRDLDLLVPLDYKIEGIENIGPQKPTSPLTQTMSTLYPILLGDNCLQ